ncbi:MAG: TIGR02757 family protein [Bdellovibrionota bacterium]
MVKILLDRLYVKYNRKEFLYSDPLEFVHRYTDPWDQEAVALISSQLAYGNVKQIRRAVEDVLERIKRLSGFPKEFVHTLGRSGGTVTDKSFLSAAYDVFGDFVYRFNTGRDIVSLLILLGKSWLAHGSLGAHFLSKLKYTDVNFSTALDSLIQDWKNWAGSFNHGLGYFLVSPHGGSCCKRWCMFLRWMGRRDALDLGLWSQSGPLIGSSRFFLRPNQLVVPLDTHTARISRYLGLTSRAGADWKAALEVTENLKFGDFSDRSDPAKYDFALARLGILDICTKRYRPEVCRSCELLGACKFTKVSLTSQENEKSCFID